ncbi:MAG: acyltransferase family protein [Heteroscytonema crispum UTEX LB 1556]
MRLTSLDVFRGITIAGMILVNMASIAEPDVYPPLLHAEWNGCTPTDLVFPFFLFIVGVAMSFSFSKYTDSNKPTSAVYWRILRRAAILFALGLLLNGFWNKGVGTFDLSNIRIMGVLQRISISYLLASLAVLNLPRKGQWILAGLLLVGYWLIMMYVPIPGHGIPDLTQKPEIVQEWNFASYSDRLIIPKAHLHGSFKNLGDPEGLFSTIPAVVSVLFGYFTGQWMREQPVISRTSVGLVLFGIGCLIIGWAWGLNFPINKKLWTSSYVVFTTGWALLLLAVCYELIEVRRIRRWGKPFEIMGLNAIAIFVASVLVIKILVKTTVGTGEKAPNAYDWIYNNLFASWAGRFNGSLFFAIVTVLLWLAVAYGMYRQRWFVKV